MTITMNINELYFYGQYNTEAYTEQEYKECCNSEMKDATKRTRRPVGLRTVWVDGEPYKVRKNTGRETIIADRL